MGRIYSLNFPDSLWYEASLTIAAQALRQGQRTEYHTFQHLPDDVRRALTGMKLDVKKLEDESCLRVLDSYTVQTGLGVSGRGPYGFQSVKLSDWSIAGVQIFKTGIPDTEKKWVHIDDNTSVLIRYNSEPAIIDFWRTRSIPASRVDQRVSLFSLLSGVASESFRSQFESLQDGIVDFKTEQKGNEIEHFVRLRILRGKRFSTRWRLITMSLDGEIVLTE